MSEKKERHWCSDDCECHKQPMTQTPPISEKNNPTMYDYHCGKCGGLVAEPMKAYGYSGQYCHCETPTHPTDMQEPSVQITTEWNLESDGDYWRIKKEQLPKYVEFNNTQVLNEVIVGIEAMKRKVAEHHGTNKYDSCYDDCITICNQLKSMKLFVFKPSNKWSYCGGGFVCIADSIEGARKLTDEKLYATEDDANQGEHGWESWTLVETLDTKETEPRVILMNYNWA